MNPYRKITFQNGSVEPTTDRCQYLWLRRFSVKYQLPSKTLWSSDFRAYCILLSIIAFCTKFWS